MKHCINEIITGLRNGYLENEINLNTLYNKAYIKDNHVKDYYFVINRGDILVKILWNNSFFFELERQLRKKYGLKPSKKEKLLTINEASDYLSFDKNFYSYYLDIKNSSFPKNMNNIKHFITNNDDEMFLLKINGYSIILQGLIGKYKGITLKYQPRNDEITIISIYERLSNEVINYLLDLPVDINIFNEYQNNLINNYKDTILIEDNISDRIYRHKISNNECHKVKKK